MPGPAAHSAPARQEHARGGAPCRSGGFHLCAARAAASPRKSPGYPAACPAQCRDSGRRRPWSARPKRGRRARHTLRRAARQALAHAAHSRTAQAQPTAAPVIRLLRKRKLPHLPMAGMMSSVPRIELRRSATGCSADSRRLMCVSMGGGPGLPPTRGVVSRGMAPAARATSAAQLRPSAKVQAKAVGRSELWRRSKSYETETESAELQNNRRST